MLDLENNLEEIILPGKEINYYKNLYTELISNCKLRGLNKLLLNFYTETHHILPRCLGGGDEENNLVLLTPLEHLVAHILLLRQDETNLKHIYAVRCFLLLPDQHRKDIQTITQFINLAAEVREKLGVSVVCFDEDITIYRVYNKIQDVISDGFEPTTVSRAAEGFYKKGHGYNWSHLDKFAENYPIQLSNYLNNNLDDIDLFRFRRVICTDLYNNVIAIFNRTSLAVNLGFSGDGISFCINRPQENRTSGGYRWYKYLYFLKNYPDNLRQFEEDNGSVLTYEIKCPLEFSPIVVDNRVVCLDKNKKLLKTYRTAKDVFQDGIHDNSISPVLVGKRTNSAGYYWFKAETFLLNNPGYTSEDLNNYLSVKLIQQVVASDIEGNIVKIYKNAMEPHKDGIHIKYVSQALLGTRETYKGFFWTRLVDWDSNDPKLEEYFKQHPEDKP